MKIIGIILILLGAGLLFQGLSRKNSLVGQTATATDNVANAVDGGSRTPQHVVYIIGGGALLLLGIVSAFGKPSPSR